MKKHLTLVGVAALIASVAYGGNMSESVSEADFFLLPSVSKVLAKTLTMSGDMGDSFFEIDPSKKAVCPSVQPSAPAENEGLRPADLSFALKGVLNLENAAEWAPSPTHYSNGTAYHYSNGAVYHARHEKDGSLFIVTSPAHDLEEQATPYEKAVSGNLSFKEALEAVIRENPQGKVKAVIPVVQADYYMWGLVKRNHWVTASVEINNGIITKAEVLDSKGSLSGLYGGGYSIQNRLKGIQAQKIQVTTHYFGHQGITDNINCGRFVISYIDALSKGKTLK